MSETNPNISEERPVSKFLGLLPIFLGFFLLISLCISYFFIGNLAGKLGVSDDNETLGYYLVFCFFVAALSVSGIVLGIVGVKRKNIWSWIGIVLNLVILCVTPIIWLLMLTMFATAY